MPQNVFNQISNHSNHFLISELIKATSEERKTKASFELQLHDMLDSLQELVVAQLQAEAHSWTEYLHTIIKCKLNH